MTLIRSEHVAIISQFTGGFLVACQSRGHDKFLLDSKSLYIGNADMDNSYLIGLPQMFKLPNPSVVTQDITCSSLRYYYAVQPSPKRLICQALDRRGSAIARTLRLANHSSQRPERSA